MPQSKRSKSKLIKKELLAKQEKIVELAKMAWAKTLEKFIERLSM